MNLVLSSVLYAGVGLLLAPLAASFDTPYPEPKPRYTKVGNPSDCLVRADAGECAGNSNYMLLHCPFECSDTLKNENTYCNRWASEGECHHNAGYMHLRCAEACERAIVWNPWTRQSFDWQMFHAVETDNMDMYARCERRSSLLYPAFVMHDRVRKFLVGTKVEGFTYDSPSELNGLVGIVEAIAYTMRVYGVFIRTHGSPRDMSYYATLLDSVLDVGLLTQYSADVVMRSLPKWGDQLEEALQLVEWIVKAEGRSLWPKNCRSNSVEAMPSDISLISEHFSSAPESCVASEGGDCISNHLDSVESVRKLRNGVDMPVVGLGTWKLTGGDCENIVAAALKMGYRHFDTAEAYRNEWDIGWALGKAIKAEVVRRDELFIASKISDQQHAGAAGVRQLVLQQLKYLQIDYFDLYMLHSPLPDSLQAETWAELEKMYDEGLIRSLGVSNFGLYELSKLLESSRIQPMVLQNKFDVYHQGTQFDNQGLNFVNYCAEHNIALVSYSPFSAYPFTMVPLADPIVQHVAERNDLTAAETLLLWHLQQGLAVIPRSSRGPGLRENLLQRLRLSDESAVIRGVLSSNDMKLLSTLQHLISTPVTLASK